MESKSKLDFAKEWPEEAASYVRAVHQGSTEREAIFVPRLVTWVPVCTEMCQEVAVVQSLSHVPLFVTQWTAARQALLSSPSPRACSNSCSLSWWCHPTITFSVIPFSSCLQSFPASGSFLMSQLFTSGGQSIRASASASVLPMNIQDWFSLGLTGLISLLFKGLSGVFSTVWKHQFFGALPFLLSSSPIHTWPLEKPQLWLDGPL